MARPRLAAPPNVRAISTLRGGGVSHGRYASLNLGGHVQDAPEAVAENRRRFCLAADLPAEPVWLAQVHGVRIADLDAADVPPAPGAPTAAGVPTAPHVPPTAPASTHTPPVADGAVTRVPGRICAILTADCLPVLFASEAGMRWAPRTPAGEGWRAEYSRPRRPRSQWRRPRCSRGWARHRTPAISRWARVRDALLKGDPGALAAFEPNARGRFMADLPELARRRLRRLGITRIFGGDVCTHAEPARCFSHRRDGETGRQATLVWLKCRI